MRKTNLLITGADGLLGNALLQYAQRENVKVAGLDRDGLDVTDEGDVARAVETTTPTLILNCAVIEPKDCENKPDAAQRVNVVGVKNLLAHKGDAKLVHFSSPAIFDGLPPLKVRAPTTSSDAGYSEADKPKPQSVYGKTKWQSELVLAGTDSIIIRTSWLYSEA